MKKPLKAKYVKDTQYPVHLFASDWYGGSADNHFLSILEAKALVEDLQIAISIAIKQSEK